MWAGDLQRLKEAVEREAWATKTRARVKPTKKKSNKKGRT